MSRTRLVLEVIRSFQKEDKVSLDKNRGALGVDYKEGRVVSLLPQIQADTTKVLECLITEGIVSSKKRPQSLNKILNFPDHLIVRYFNSVANGLLLHYCCSDNVGSIRGVVLYFLKCSLAKTLATKHKLRSISKVFAQWGPNLSIKYGRGKVCSFISKVEVESLGKKFLTNVMDYREVVHKTYKKLRSFSLVGGKCIVKGCFEVESIEMSHIKKVYKDFYLDSRGNKIINIWFTPGVGFTRKNSLELVLRWKQILLCKNHYFKWYNGTLSKNDIGEPFRWLKNLV